MRQGERRLVVLNGCGLTGGASGEGEPVGVPADDASAVPPSSGEFARWMGRQRWLLRWSCRRLDRLARELRRNGWATEQRYEPGHVPPVLHVFAENAPAVGDSVTVVRGPVVWWYRSSTGAWLGPCMEPWRAAESVTALLGMWGISAGGLGTPRDR